jgi:hypothetical protein
MKYGRVILAGVWAVLFCGAWADRAEGQGAAKVLVPHSLWNCGMAKGFPSPESGSLIFEG